MFYCQICMFETISLISYLNHHRYHTNITRFYYCGFMKYGKFFQKSSFLTKNLLRLHRFKQSTNQKSIVKDATCIPDNQCKYICSRLKFHIRRSEKIVCPYPCCTKRYKVVSSFTSHLTKIHRSCNYNTNISQGNQDIIDTSTSEIFEVLNKAEILPMSSNNVHLEINDHLNVNSTEL
ncbi:hypothetical protein PUN28_020857 [Cardiocondyla obscurior]|uniref:C2H2-type domain-containing protein n=1 Tax=Cardiocondyla obscurior TaxID=286306 RepID=A0AAW2E7B7_9HYME